MGNSTKKAFQPPSLLIEAQPPSAGLGSLGGGTDGWYLSSRGRFSTSGSLTLAHCGELLPGHVHVVGGELPGLVLVLVEPGVLVAG